MRVNLKTKITHYEKISLSKSIMNETLRFRKFQLNYDNKDDIVQLSQRILTSELNNENLI